MTTTAEAIVILLEGLGAQDARRVRRMRRAAVALEESTR